MGIQQRILVVDDSLSICHQVKKILRDAPLEVHEAHTGEEALRKVKELQPDLILLDVILPDTDGYELFYELKEADTNHAVILFLTSKNGDEDVVRGFTLGAWDYIKKPFTNGELKQRIFSHLDVKKQRDDLYRQNAALKSDMERLNYMAFRDGLTGLYNRRYAIEQLPQDLLGTEQTVLVLADIDDFKNINDTYGHDAGDKLLICIAQIFDGINAEHITVRWGGEEFLIILFHVSSEEAMRQMDQLRQEIEQFQVQHQKKHFSCSMTFGLYSYQAQQAIDENVHCADQALYQGKRKGKNCCRWYQMDGCEST